MTRLLGPPPSTWIPRKRCRVMFDRRAASPDGEATRTSLVEVFMRDTPPWVTLEDVTVNEGYIARWNPTLPARVVDAARGRVVATLDDPHYHLDHPLHWPTAGGRRKYLIGPAYLDVALREWVYIV